MNLTPLSHFGELSVVLSSSSSANLLFWTALLMFLNSSVMQPPSEYVCMGAGIAASQNNTPLTLIIIVAAASNFLGTSVWYLLGRADFDLNRRIGRLRLDNIPIIRPYTKYLVQIGRLFQRRAAFALFALRLVPLVRSIVSFPAGLIRVRPEVFILSSLAGIALWCTVWVLIGAYLGRLRLFVAASIAISIGVCVMLLFWAIDRRLSPEDIHDSSR